MIYSSIYCQLLYTLIFIIFIIYYTLQECIRFEFYENTENNFGQSELVQFTCKNKGGSVINFHSDFLPVHGPIVFNITFHCCAHNLCKSDHDCPINFNCNQGKCQVANCPLTDEIDLVQQEGRECFIDDDCHFEIPYDAKNWKCLEDPKCSTEKNCTTTFTFCKRCGTGYLETVSTSTLAKPIPWWLTTVLSSTKEQNLFPPLSSVDLTDTSLNNNITVETNDKSLFDNINTINISSIDNIFTSHENINLPPLNITSLEDNDDNNIPFSRTTSSFDYYTRDENDNNDNNDINRSYNIPNSTDINFII